MSLSVVISLKAGDFGLTVAFEAGGETTAILGPSGAGKSLTLRAIAGLVRPSTGRIALDGESLFDSKDGTDVPARRRGVGYVFQDYALFPHLTVAQNISFGLHGAKGDEKRSAVADMVDLLRLHGLEDRYPRRLSGGERQRVALGRALAPHPRLLLLDEPFSALDAPARESLTQEFLMLRERIAVPAILVTHDVAEAYALSSDLVVIERGMVLQSGPRASVSNAPLTPRVAALVGYQNLLDGIATAAGTVDAGGIEVTSVGVVPGVRVTVGLRASDLRAVPDPDGNVRLERTVDRGAQVVGWFVTDAGAKVACMLDRLPAVEDGGCWRLEALPGRAVVWPCQP